MKKQMFKYEYDFGNITKDELVNIGAANNLVIFFLLLTGVYFNLFGFQIGFTALNFIWGVPYYFYGASGLGFIISFIFKFVQYKKHNFFGSKQKYLIDTSLELLFLLAFFLNAYFMVTTLPVVDNFAQINLNYIILIPVIFPLFIIFWVYIDYTAHKAVRTKLKEFKKAEKQLKI